MNVPEVWKHWRNPVRYVSIDDLGIDVKALSFQPMPTEAKETKVAHDAAPAAASAKGMTIAEAKKALAVTFGVSPDAVEITIRG